MDITLKDFQPINSWKIQNDSVVDGTTGRKFSNESKSIIRMKCALLTIGTPLVYGIVVIANLVYRLFRLLSFMPFWEKRDCTFTAKEKLNEMGTDFLRVILSPIALVGFELSAIWGVISPYDGRKVFGSTERALFNGWIIAPCFQPEDVS